MTTSTITSLAPLLARLFDEADQYLPAGTDVAILRYEGGLAYVTPLVSAQDDVFLAPEAGNGAPGGELSDGGSREATGGAKHELAE